MFTWNFCKRDNSNIISIFQIRYYVAKQVELFPEIEDIEKRLNNENKNLLDNLCNRQWLC